MDVACSLCAGIGKGQTTNQSYIYVMVIDEENEMDVKQVGQIYGTEREPNPQAGRIYAIDGKEARIRRLTPRECFRLQGWSDDYFEKAQFVNSDSQLYKQAGNGVTVTVIEAIAKKLDLKEEQA